MARTIGVEMIEGDFTPYDVCAADEAFTTGTSESIMPVRSLNGVDLPPPIPGALTLKLIEVWNEMTGIDIVRQAVSHHR